MGWKAIADYLDVSERMAMRWHQNWGMPVATFPGRRVFTTENALTEWIFKLDRMQRKVLDEIGGNPDRLPYWKLFQRYCRETAADQTHHGK